MNHRRTAHRTRRPACRDHAEALQSLAGDVVIAYRRVAAFRSVVDGRPANVVDYAGKVVALEAAWDDLLEALAA